MYTRNPFLIHTVYMNFRMVCTIMNHMIQFIQHSLLKFIRHEEIQIYHPITDPLWFTSKSSFKGTVDKSTGWDFVLIL